ncbi:hypothetical protein MRX96_035725 [Rhipicephalus microplus]
MMEPASAIAALTLSHCGCRSPVASPSSDPMASSSRSSEPQDLGRGRSTGFTEYTRVTCIAYRYCASPNEEKQDVSLFERGV